MVNFKTLNSQKPIEKRIVKAGLSLAIIFSKEEISRLDLAYGKKVNLDNAEVVEETENSEK